MKPGSQRRFEILIHLHWYTNDKYFPLVVHLVVMVDVVGFSLWRCSTTIITNNCHLLYCHVARRRQLSILHYVPALVTKVVLNDNDPPFLWWWCHRDWSLGYPAKVTEGGSSSITAGRTGRWICSCRLHSGLRGLVSHHWAGVTSNKP